MAKNYQFDYTTVVIANGATVSSVLTLNGSRILLGFTTPAAITSTAITFQGSFDNTNFFPLYDESTSYSITTSTSRFHALKRQVFDGVRYVKLVGGSAEGASRTISVVMGE